MIVKFIFEMAIQKVISQTYCMTEALNGTAHIARVFEVFQSSESHHGILRFDTVQVPIIYCVYSATFLLMIFAVVLLALLATIGNTHAFTVDCESLDFEAIVALSENLRVFFTLW